MDCVARLPAQDHAAAGTAALDDAKGPGFGRLVHRRTIDGQAPCNHRPGDAA